MNFGNKTKPGMLTELNFPTVLQSPRNSIPTFQVCSLARSYRSPAIKKKEHEASRSYFRLVYTIKLQNIGLEPFIFKKFIICSSLNLSAFSLYSKRSSIIFSKFSAQISIFWLHLLEFSFPPLI